MKRKLYKFSHSVCQGGYCYVHRTKDDRKIQNTFGLRNSLQAISKKFELIDTTIKIYDNIFFFFFMTKPMVKPPELVDSIHKTMDLFDEDWDKEYLYTGVYDLQEEYLRKHLRELGFDYDQ